MKREYIRSFSVFTNKNGIGRGQVCILLYCKSYKFGGNKVEGVHQLKIPKLHLKHIESVKHKKTFSVAKKKKKKKPIHTKDVGKAIIQSQHPVNRREENKSIILHKVSP